MVLRHVWQLLLDYACIVLVGDHPYILGVNNGFETVYGQLQQRFSRTQYVNELLWLFRGTHWPKAASYAASHDNEVIVDFSHIRNLNIKKTKKGLLHTAPY
jgi:hypothetical protein